MRCKAITQNGRRCKLEEVIRGFCIIHLQKRKSIIIKKICNEKGCTNKLNYYNTSGYCIYHAPKHKIKKC